MPAFTLDALAPLTPAEFVRLVKATPDREISAALGGPERGPILDAIFGRFPEMFVADRAQGVDARINFRVSGGPDGSSGTYAVVIADGECTVEKAPTTEPTVSLMAGPVDFLKLITGTGNAVMMVMTGKLKARGDLGLAQSFVRYFDLPKP